MARNSILLSFAGVASSICLAAATAFAAPAPAGSIYHSDFADYDSQWWTLPYLPPPNVTQGIDEADVQITPTSEVRFSSRDNIDPGLFSLDDLEIQLEVDMLDADRLELWLAFYGVDGIWIDSTRVLNTRMITPDEALSIPLGGTATPAGWVDFRFLFFIRRGAEPATNTVTFDELALLPAASVVIPEPSTALLIGLGLEGLGASRRQS